MVNCAAAVTDAPFLAIVGHRVCNGVDYVGVGHALGDRRLQRLAIPHDDGIQIIDDLQKTGVLVQSSTCVPFPGELDEDGMRHALRPQCLRSLANPCDDRRCIINDLHATPTDIPALSLGSS